MVPSTEKKTPRGPSPPLPPTVEAFAWNTIPATHSRPMTGACTPPQPRHLGLEKLGTARGATTTTPASTHQPPTPPPRHHETSITVEGEKKKHHHLVDVCCPHAATARRPQPGIATASRPATATATASWPRPATTVAHHSQPLSTLATAPPAPPCATTPIAAATVDPRHPQQPPVMSESVMAAIVVVRLRSSPLHALPHTPIAQPPDPVGTPPDLAATASTSVDGRPSTTNFPRGHGGHAHPRPSGKREEGHATTIPTGCASSGGS
jgi:hypothetical protein